MSGRTPNDEAVRRALRRWSRPAELAAFAVARHGFGDSDGGFGVTYPGDLDDFDRAMGCEIAEGWVLVYGFHGPPDGYEYPTREVDYLRELADFLAARGHLAEAALVRSLALD